MTAPDVGSVEDVLLQQHELKVECTHPKYPRNVMHVFDKIDTVMNGMSLC